jgi:FixJ family two-component response regulator
MKPASSNMTTDSTTIAIIEDDASMRASLVRVLNVMGYDTEQYDSAEQFLSNADRCKAICLIIDVHLGTMSGLDLAQHPAVVALERPVILSSASEDGEIRKRATATGRCAFLSKPFTATELLAVLVSTAG